MEREIKFRAWDANFQTMITPYCELIDGYFWGEDCTNTGYSVKHEHVMQYTGLKDKNGKEIYEGDIVKWDDGSNGKYWRVAEVFYDTNTYMYSFRILYGINCNIEKGYVFGGNFACRGQNPSEEIEVIGNIYENPELLK